MQTEFIQAKPEEVYEALMDPTKHSSFTGSKATCDTVVGGKFTAWDGYIIGRNLELEKGKKILQEWKTTEFPKNYPPSLLELTFRAKKGGTEVKMIHSKVPASQMENYRQGWMDSYWIPLRNYFEKKKK